MSHDDNIAVRQRREQERVSRLCQRDGMTGRFGVNEMRYQLRQPPFAKLRHFEPRLASLNRPFPVRSGTLEPATLSLAQRRVK